MKIIIPMTGYGSRFVAAGYKDLKPFIKVDGKRTILEWIVQGMYSPEDEFLFVCRKEHLQKIKGGGMRDFLYSLSKHVEIAAIDDWVKKGPVYDVLRASHYIDDDEECIINYCDVYLDWDWDKLREGIHGQDCDGCVVCFHGFHSALVSEKNVFASCLIDENGLLKEIREKYSYTADKKDGYHSAGVYYFKSGRICKKYLQELVDSGQMVQGEYYVSLVYNFMVKDHLRVWAPYGLKVFCNWGTPEDLEDYMFWIDAAKKIENPVNILIPMAGAGKRFVNAGYSTHKPALPVVDYKTGEEVPMVVAAVGDLPSVGKNGRNLIFIDRDFHKTQGTEGMIRQYYSEAQFVTLDRLTEGQASTCLTAKGLIDNRDELLISACDNGMVFDRLEFDRLRKECDCIVFTQKSHVVLENPNAYGWCVVDQDGSVLRVSVKRAISDTPEKDHAVVATFWFKRGCIFVKAAERMIKENDRINNEFYVDQAINYVIGLGCKVKALCIDKYIGWGTPEDYENYCNNLMYWRGFVRSGHFLDK